MDYLRLFCQGDERGFTYYYNLWYVKLFWFAKKMVEDEDLSADIAQEAYIGIWKINKQDFSHENIIKDYLYTSVKNACLNHFKKQEVIQRHRIEVIKTTNEAEETEQEENKREKIASVQKFLKYLPRECRKVMELRFVEGLSLDEISDHLKVAKRTVKNHRLRGIELIKEMMEGKRPAESIELDSFVTPEIITVEYVEKNAALLSVFLPKMPSNWKKVVKLYAMGKTEELQALKISFRKSDGKPYHNSIFYRTRKRAFKELKKRMEFSLEYRQMPKNILKLTIEKIASFRDTDKRVLSLILQGMEAKEIKEATELSDRSIKNVCKGVVASIASIYDHPDLSVSNMSACEKLAKFLTGGGKSVATSLKDSTALELSEKGKYDIPHEQILEMRKTMKPKMIAAILRLPTKTIHQKIHYAKRVLKIA